MKKEELKLSLDVRATENEINFEFILNKNTIAFFKFNPERLLEVLKKGTEITIKK